MNWNARCISDYLAAIKATGQPKNDAAAYDVRIVEAAVPEGQVYWRVIGVYHLAPVENQSNHVVFVEALDENGQRIRNPDPWVGWTWEGRHANEVANPVQLDKGANEPGGNIPLTKDQKVKVWMNGMRRDGNELSDRVENVHTVHADEPGPHGETWNSIGHHSFYVVFQRTRRAQLMPADGVIRGHVANGTGYRALLWRGDKLVGEQTVDRDCNFAFTGLPAGAYRVEAEPPSLQSDPIELGAGQKNVDVNLIAPE